MRTALYLGIVFGVSGVATTALAQQFFCMTSSQFPFEQVQFRFEQVMKVTRRYSNRLTDEFVTGESRIGDRISI